MGEVINIEDFPQLYLFWFSCLFVCFLGGGLGPALCAYKLSSLLPSHFLSPLTCQSCSSLKTDLKGHISLEAFSAPPTFLLVFLGPCQSLYYSLCTHNLCTSYLLN